MTSRTRTTCPLNQRGAAGDYENWKGTPAVNSFYRKLDGINAELLDRTEFRWPPPPAGARRQLVDDPIPYSIAPEPPTPPLPSTPAETPPSPEPDRPV